jgi:crotonobetainyl-CoA:carnitine CoA-transferase CaiB-like acyl-CoA transferase
MILAEFGAEVIKIEEPGRGDELRRAEPLYGGESAYFFVANRAKKSVTANLKHPEGLALVKDLAQNCDILIENFVPGTAARLGVDYATMHAINPELIYISCSGFGQTGPYAQRRGYDTVFQAMTGMMALTGEPDGPPLKAGLPAADTGSALWVAIACLLGLAGRTASGHGAHYDFSMADGQVSLLAVAAARYFATGTPPGRMGTQHAGRVPSGAFKCRDGKWLQLTCSDGQWPDLCRLFGHDEWATDTELAKTKGRIARRLEIVNYLEKTIAGWERAALLARCDEMGVPAGPIYEIDEVLADPHFVARGMVGSFEHPTVGQFPALAMPIKITGMDDAEIGTPPILGEHTDQVLIDMLGYSEADVAELRQRGAI